MWEIPSSDENDFDEYSFTLSTMRICRSVIGTSNQQWVRQHEKRLLLRSTYLENKSWIWLIYLPNTNNQSVVGVNHSKYMMRQQLQLSIIGSSINTLMSVLLKIWAQRSDASKVLIRITWFVLLVGKRVLLVFCYLRRLFLFSTGGHNVLDPQLFT